ncbi:MAG: site-2 protease family protein [Eubacteriales bacterium]|nr:site-2 protease family protein [Eubacteriales bacterium]MDY3332174.1 site-2 protease family protein [Gallibacter sp.]
MRRNSSGTFLIILFVMILAKMRYSGAINPQDMILQTLLMLPGIIIGLSFHEFSHAFVAYKLGDNTPKLQGRVTLNPLAHIDPFGFIALLFAGFGWGKPVQVDPFNFKNRRRDELLVSLAGVTMNLILAIAFTVILKFAFTDVYFKSDGLMYIFYQMVFYAILINVMLMIFNLLPIPPLDGFNIVTEAFDLRRYSWYYTVYNNGFLILMIFIVFGGTQRILGPIMQYILGILL